VPAEIRKRLGVGPGSILEWNQENGQIVVRRAGQFSSSDIHEALFPPDTQPMQPAEVKEGIRKYMRKRHALD